MLKNQGLDISVAIIADDMSSAKEISLALRKLNIFAYHYQNLEEYWVSTHLQIPDLTIIDVTKMSQGNLQFASHPLVVQEKLNYAFFSKDSTKFLLKSTLALKPIGYLSLDVTLDFTLKQLITHMISEKENTQTIAELSQRVERLKARNQKIISERSEAEEFKAQINQIQNFSNSVFKLMERTDFQNALIQSLSEWVDIDAFGIYELSRDGQRLISPESTAKNYNPLPSLFLGHKSQSSIEAFAKEMAGQVALDLFEMTPIVLEIKGLKTEVLLYLSFKSEYLINYPWELLEKEISRLYQSSKISHQAPKLAGQFLPMWEALDYMDKLGQDLQSGVKVLVLDLSPLLRVATSKTSNKFYWSTFYNEFFLQLSNVISPSTKLSVQGPWEITFFVEDSLLEKDSFALQAFVKKYSYWKYFQDQSSILPEDIHPTLRITPASSSLYLRGFEKNHKETVSQPTQGLRRRGGQLTV